jgi:hypothetical protein
MLSGMPAALRLSIPGAAGAAAEGTGSVQETMGRHKRNNNLADKGLNMKGLCTHRVAP